MSLLQISLEAEDEVILLPMAKDFRNRNCCKIYGIVDRVGPIDAQNTSRTAKIKGADISFLSRVEAPGLAVVEQHNDDASPIDCSFGVDSKRSVFQDSRDQPDKLGGRSFDLSVDFSV